MLSKKMQEALNKHINAEIYSSYLYLAMSAYFSSENLKGFANWMRVQSQEEMMHAYKALGYMLDRGGKVNLLQIDAPKSSWKNALAAMEETLAHEKEVTKRINNLMDLAIAEKDHATAIFLQWFVTEQIEEEANVEEILVPLKSFGDSAQGLFMIDRRMAERK